MLKGAVLILSGKGGVGKTLIAVNLALYLKDRGAKVGLLDADFSASNTGFFLGLKGEQMQLEREQFHPAVVDGLEVFSIPLVIGDNSVSMDGSQYSEFLRDAVTATAWSCDYLIVDCPAGYDDRLQMAAKVFSETLLGSVIILMPAHELDARKAIMLHRDLGMPILGLIENMSYFTTGEKTDNPNYEIFGESVVEKLGKEFEVPVFGKIPLSMDIRNHVAEKNPKLAGEYAEPVIKAVDAILKANPQKPGFLAGLKKILVGSLTKMFFELVVAINTEINIPQVQQAYGYPGGTIIRLRILDDVMEPIGKATDWVVNEGKLTLVQGEYQPDVQLDIMAKAFKWALLRNKVLSNGQIYTFQDALRLGHMRIYGDKSMAKGAFFMQHVFEQVSQNEKAIGRIAPFLEVL
jgi:ATP-binding protein involved in chromosome partitioning